MKYLISLFVFLGLMLSPVKAGVVVGSDGYSFQGKEFDRKEFRLYVVTYDDIFTLRAKAKEVGFPNYDKIMAFTIPYPGLGICQIHVINPEVYYIPEYIGHELTHCMYGRFHSF